MAGEKAAVAKHSLVKRIGYAKTLVVTSNVTTDAERNTGHTNLAKLA